MLKILTWNDATAACKLVICLALSTMNQIFLSVGYQTKTTKKMLCKLAWFTADESKCETIRTWRKIILPRLLKLDAYRFKICLVAEALLQNGKFDHHMHLLMEGQGEKVEQWREDCEAERELKGEGGAIPQGR